MRRACKVGTTSLRTLGDDEQPGIDEYLYEGDLEYTPDGDLEMVWDDTLGGVRPLNPDEIIATKLTQTIIAIKGECQRRIYVRYPQTKQANLTARMLELLVQGVTAGTEVTQISAVWEWVKAMRIHSDNLEVQAAANSDLDILSGWPE